MKFPAVRRRRAFVGLCLPLLAVAVAELNVSGLSLSFSLGTQPSALAGVSGP